MSKWLPTPAELPEITFDGDTINVKSKRLKISDMSSLVGKKFDLNSDEGRLGVTQLGAEVLPKYLVSIEGLTDANGGAIDLQTYLDNIDDFYFASLTAAILFGLLSVSSVNGDLPK